MFINFVRNSVLSILFAMNKLKHILFVLFTALLIYGCWGNSNNTVANPSDDASILQVAIQPNTASPNASSAVFTIDNVNKRIYNVDSLPYGTRIDSLFISFKFASSLGFIMNDTITQSNYYSQAITNRAYDFTKKVTIKNLASNGTNTEKYTIELNVHRVKTYLHAWTRLTSDITNGMNSANQKAIQLKGKFFFYVGTDGSNILYTSTDAKQWNLASSLVGLPAGTALSNIITHKDNAYLLHNGDRLYKTENGTEWTQHVISGHTDYNYTTLLFSLKNRLWAIAQHKADKSIRIATSADGIDWTFSGKKTFRNDFPIAGFAVTAFQPSYSNREKAMIIGGMSSENKRLNTIWSAESKIYTDTLNWVDLQYEKSNLPATLDAGAVYYGAKLLLIGGLLEGKNTPDTLQLRQSINEGMNWTPSDTTINKLPKNFIPRSNMSIIRDDADKSIYVIGGKSASEPLSDVWKVKVNFYSFDDYKINPNKY